MALRVIYDLFTLIPSTGFLSVVSSERDRFDLLKNTFQALLKSAIN